MAGSVLVAMGDTRPDRQTRGRDVRDVANAGGTGADGAWPVTGDAPIGSGSAPTVTGSAPTDSAPTHSVPTDSAPTDSAPTDSAPTHSARGDGAPTGGARGDGASARGRRARHLGALVLAGAVGALGATLVVITGGRLALGPVVRPPTAWFGLLDPVATDKPSLLPVVLLLGATLLVGAWWWACRRSQRGELSLRGVAALICCWSAAPLFGPPILSLDVYSYVAQGAMLSAGLDPYAAGPALLGSHPAALAADPIWQDTPSPYGPVGLGLFHAVTALTGGRVVRSVILLRVVTTVAVAALAWCLVRAVPAHRRPWALAAGVGGPVVLLELLGAVHLEAVMMALAAAGLLAALRGRVGLGLALLTAAALTKWPAAMIMVVLLARRWADLAVGPAAAAEPEPEPESAPNPADGPSPGAPVRTRTATGSLAGRGLALGRRLAAAITASAPVRWVGGGGTDRRWALPGPSTRGPVARVLTAMIRDLAVIAATATVLSLLLVPDGLGWVRATSTPSHGLSLYSPVSALANLLAIVTDTPGPALPGSDLLGLARAAGMAGAALLIGWLLITVRRRDVPATCGLALLSLALLGPVLYPWYLVWGMVPLVMARGVPRRRVLMAVGAAGAFLSVPHPEVLFVGEPEVTSWFAREGPVVLIVLLVCAGVGLIARRRLVSGTRAEVYRSM
ncbi:MULTISPECIES: polyprenol phosphomannose-dependent alpha 1,6 mannosyltransferase MptB [unclassified Pseudofrankia]|uniref:polyprenol phosphomannose-dependent alpha 1,6 mannosyltransferase MptB n=1 Tax=unclassified Pseudofrankia TaxID=2994372 RepID=UPI001F517400|nr:MULTISPECIES: polyprenol phosphomannose-dependent alpha 1,6 mannosyltransferase MptB [unclassified Pseudofrankia]MDT3445034.1 polyprenol phosphomannose-dependent alpha 1,6 mannosyltransferase MptB [Pseudofrankia sp. BMG5.37]